MLSSTCDDCVLLLGVLGLSLLLSQQNTRQMQSLCAHGKDVGDASMSKEAPAVKKLLEEFIFRSVEKSRFSLCSCFLAEISDQPSRILVRPLFCFLVDCES